MRGLAILFVFLIAVIVGYYFGSIYTSPIIIRQNTTLTTTNTLTTTITTTTEIMPSFRIYAVKIYPAYLFDYGGEDPYPIDAELHFGFRLKPPPEGYKYFSLLIYH